MSDNLKHAIALSKQADTDSLDCCLAQVCQSFFADFDLRIYKVSRQNSSSNNPLYQQFNYREQKDADFCFLWDQDLRLEEGADSEPFRTCIHTNQVVRFSNQQTHHILIPYAHKNINHGVIEILHNISDQYIDDFIELIQIYENIYNILNDNERDQLTGLYNRKTFDKKLSKLLSLQIEKQAQYKNDQNRQLQDGTLSWLVAIDIDHFKQVNDQFGHLYGDEVLLRLAQVMQNTFRSMDLIFRFGGEEFIIILEPTERSMAYKALERFRKTVSEYDFPLVGNITISTGFARITVNDYPSHILDCADKALYYAKDHGRNCTYNFEELVEKNELQISETISNNEIDLF